MAQLRAWLTIAHGAGAQPVLKALAYANALVDLSGPLAYEAAYERRRAPGDEGP
jgi:hypothetical protein